MTPRPPELSDSDFESSDEEFMFSGDYDMDGNRIRPKRPEPVFNRVQDVTSQVITSLSNGDVTEFSRIWEANRDILDVNKPLLTYNSTPLMIACQGRYVGLTKYLLVALNADPNADSNDMTALILTCCGEMDLYGFHGNSTEEQSKVFEICQQLIQHKAMVDKANLRRQTALMFAAKNGFVSVIQLLLQNRATLEACDNDEKTALFYAVEGNQFEAVKTLLEAGALINVQDRFNNTPKRLAVEEEFDDIVALFPPDPIVECVPSSHRSYDSYMDHVPSAFPNKETPAYSPDIYSMLHGMRVQDLEYKFYESQIGLPEFLTITENHLEEIGITFPYQRKRILFGLLRFHEKAWSKSALRFPKPESDILQYFDVFANCLKQLVIVKTSLDFITNHPIFADCQNSSDRIYELREEIEHQLTSIRDKTVKLMQDMQKIVDKQDVPPPQFICQKAITDRLNMQTVFRSRIYRKIKIIGGIGLAIAAIVVIKSRLR